MPIAFPLSSRDSLPIRQWWLAQTTKAFDVVPAPNMGSPGSAFGKTSVGRFDPRSLDPGIGVMPKQAVNLRRLATMYQDPQQTSVVNPSALLYELYDQTVGYDRDLGQQNIRIVGVSRDATGAALGTCVVKVFQTTSDLLCASTVSDGSGNWTAYPNLPGPY